MKDSKISPLCKKIFTVAPCDSKANRDCQDCKNAFKNRKTRCTSTCSEFKDPTRRCNREIYHDGSIYHCLQHKCELQQLTENLSILKKKFNVLYGKLPWRKGKDGKLEIKKIEKDVSNMFPTLSMDDVVRVLDIVNQMIVTRDKISNKYKFVTGLEFQEKQKRERLEANHRIMREYLQIIFDTLSDLVSQKLSLTSF